MKKNSKQHILHNKTEQIMTNYLSVWHPKLRLSSFEHECDSTIKWAAQYGRQLVNRECKVQKAGSVPFDFPACAPSHHFHVHIFNIFLNLSI